mmetsp:Transcript_33313/g.77909  ORF Transcript_33313/g.77909 Transcript_33313/m.77909 type:complete len:364 (+) Transcript_33313:255-1346(+)
MASTRRSWQTSRCRRASRSSTASSATPPPTSSPSSRNVRWACLPHCAVSFWPRSASCRERKSGPGASLSSGTASAPPLTSLCSEAICQGSRRTRRRSVRPSAPISSGMGRWRRQRLRTMSKSRQPRTSPTTAVAACPVLRRMRRANGRDWRDWRGANAQHPHRQPSAQRRRSRSGRPWWSSYAMARPSTTSSASSQAGKTHRLPRRGVRKPPRPASFLRRTAFLSTSCTRRGCPVPSRQLGSSSPRLIACGRPSTSRGGSMSVCTARSPASLRSELARNTARSSSSYGGDRLIQRRHGWILSRRTTPATISVTYKMCSTCASLSKRHWYARLRWAVCASTASCPALSPSKIAWSGRSRTTWML